jgi:hypothetical protein
MIFHPERGSPNTLAVARMEARMSGKGDCYVNAAAESYVATLEFELLWLSNRHTRAEARQAVLRYMETW